MKSIIIAAAVLVGTSTQVTAGPVTTHELYLEQRECRTVPERETGYLRAGDEVVRFTTPEHQECSYVPTHRIRSRTQYHR